PVSNPYFTDLCLEPFFVSTHLVVSGLKAVETKSARSVRRCRTLLLSILQQIYLSAQKCSATLILNTSRDRESRRDLSVKGAVLYKKHKNTKAQQNAANAKS